MIVFDDFKLLLTSIGQQDKEQKYEQTENFYKTLSYYSHEYRDFVERFFEDYSSSDVSLIGNVINTLSCFYPFCSELTQEILKEWKNRDKDSFHSYMREKHFEKLVIFPFDDSCSHSDTDYSKQKQSELQKEIEQASKLLAEKERDLANLEKQKQKSYAKINERMAKIAELEKKKAELMKMYSDEIVRQTEEEKNKNLKDDKLYNIINHSDLEELILSRSGYQDSSENYKKLQKIFDKYRQEN
jgi:hypothetical protein